MDSNSSGMAFSDPWKEFTMVNPATPSMKRCWNMSGMLAALATFPTKSSTGWHFTEQTPFAFRVLSQYKYCLSRQIGEAMKIQHTRDNILKCRCEYLSNLQLWKMTGRGGRGRNMKRLLKKQNWRSSGWKRWAKLAGVKTLPWRRSSIIIIMLKSLTLGACQRRRVVTLHLAVKTTKCFRDQQDVLRCKRRISSF